MIGEMAARSVVVGASQASRYAASGTFASTTTCLPPGSRTTRSGRSSGPRPSSRSSLLVEVAVGQHPAALDDALELHLAPATAHVRRPERLDEVARLEPEPLLRARERSDAASLRRTPPGAPSPCRSSTHPFERVLQRRDVAVSCVLATSRNDELVCRSASDDSAWNASRASATTERARREFGSSVNSVSS